jgi:hypothetical protein
MSGELVLEAIDGSNPLGFLVALGALRLSQLHWPEASVTVAWERAGRWRPRLSGVPTTDRREFCLELLGSPGVPVETFDGLGKNITVSPDVFRRFARKGREAATRKDRRVADFAAAFGCEDCRDEKRNRIQYTALCFITGSGHQDFLGTMAALMDSVKVTHLQEALFEGWQTRDKGFALRWDPGDAREYALRWNDPGPEGAWTTWGANRLATEALPFFPAYPSGARLLTTGFDRRRKEFTWPVWTDSLNCDEVKSLLSWDELQREAPQSPVLKARGVQEVFRAARVRIGTGANFKVSFRPARAI